MATVEVYNCERRAQTVAAIKYLRQLRGLNLAEAKALIDAVYCHFRAVSLAFATDVDAGVFVQQM